MTWDHFKDHYLAFDAVDFAIDVSRVDFSEGFFETMAPKMATAIEAMEALEGGAIANPDEGRRVGHYWLRNPELAPDPAITQAISETILRIEALVKKVHSGELKGASGSFKNLLCIGIGGSALGPQFVAQALGNPGLVTYTAPNG